MRIASVILDIPTQALEDAYSYRVPDHLVDIATGCAVVVPFGHRRAIGFVMDMHTTNDVANLGIDPEKLKDIHDVVSRPYFNAQGAACARFLAHEYLAPLSSCVRLFTPPGGVPTMKHKGKAWVVEQPSIGEVDDRWVKLGPAAQAYTPRKSAVKQIAILDALAQGQLRVADLTAEYGSISSALKALATRGVVEIEHRRRMRGMSSAPASPASPPIYTSIAFEPSARPALTAGQKQALRIIGQAQDNANGQVVLIDGVTGSGKTEVYLQAIERTVSEGKTAIVLVPEISLTPQTVARFRGRFGHMVAVMHSRMSQGERYDQWDFVRNGDARVVVGARSALFTPVENLGLVVIDEEHESSYKQDSQPRYVARDVAVWMAKQAKAVVVLGSATPSIESLYRAQTDPMWQIVQLPERANGKPLPRIEIVDMAHEFGSGNRSMFSRRLQDALHATLAANQKAVLLLNQRGFAKFLLCRDCGYVPECPDCSVSLTYHEKGNVLVCHHCGYRVPAPVTCPQCEGPYLKKFGAGTQRVEAELKALIASFDDIDAAVIRMDADTTATKGAHQKLLEQFAAEKAAVLLGTQMIAKGLDFDDVTLVGVINADTQLRLPDFRAAERTFDLIEQVAGRAGRADLSGVVIVQTYWAAAVPIQAAAAYDRDTFLEDELEKRRILAYPPYVRLADIRIWGKQEKDVAEEAERVFERVSQQVEQTVGHSWTLLPPTPCVIERTRGNYRYHITIKAPDRAPIADVLSPVFRNRKSTKGINVAVDIDPSSLL